MKRHNRFGQCRYCGVELVDWARVYKRDVADAEYTFAMLKTELVRHQFWHVEIDEKAINHARRKGVLGMRLAAEKRIRQSVASPHPVRDGYQTPYKGNSLYYAQHATATCCRACIQEWHNILKERELTEEEIEYLTKLVFLYVRERLPQLTLEGEKVPAIRLGVLSTPKPKHNEDGAR